MLLRDSIVNQDLSVTSRVRAAVGLGWNLDLRDVSPLSSAALTEFFNDAVVMQ